MSQEKKTDYSFLRRKEYQINYVPINSEVYGNRRFHRISNGVMDRDFTLEEIETIIRGGDLTALRELSRYYYRTNGIYRNNIDLFASLPLYYTMVTPIYELGKGSKTQITKTFYNACDFVEKLDVKNTFTHISREWIKTGIYYGILQEKNGRVVIVDLPIEFCRTKFKNFYNLNVLEFNIMYFERKYEEELRDAAVLNFPPVVQQAWKKWKNKTLSDPWVMIPSGAGGVCFCFPEDQTPLFIASIPELHKLKDAVAREEKRDENELYKLLIQRMPLDNEGHLAFELDEVEQMHAGVAEMLQAIDTVEVLTTFGDTTLENLQDSSAATQSADRVNKYKDNAWEAIGNSPLLFNANNSSSLTYTIKKHETIMKSYLNAYNTWVTYLLNSRFTRTGLKFDFEILPLTMFNIKEYQSQFFSGAQYGYSKMQAGVALGIKQMNQISLMDFENEFLHMDEKMVPLQSSYTNSGNENKNSGESKGAGSSPKDITNKGGRPELPDEQKSEKTQANIQSMG